MKIKSGFMLRDIAGSWIVVPLGQRVVEFNGLMTLNESGALIWRKLEGGAEIDDLVQVICSEYDVDEATARIDVEEIVESIRSQNLLE